MSVLIVFAVGLVMLFVITDQVGEREPVVRRDEIDARIWLAPVAFVKVTASRQTVGQVRNQSVVAAPESAHCVSINAVPFRPERGEVSDLIAALAQVPRLGRPPCLTD